MNPPNTAKQFRRQLGILILSFLVLAGVMYWIVADDWALTAVRTDTVSMGYLLPADGEVSQQISVAMDGLEAITVVPHFDAAERSGQVTFTLADEEGTVWTAERAASALLSDQANTIAIEPGLKHVNKLTLTIAPNGTGMALWAGNTVSAGKFDVAVMTSGLTVNGAAAEGMLVLNLTGHNILQGTRWFWPGAILLLTAIVCLVCATHMQRQKGKRTLLTVMVDVCQRYRYLLRQLVNRDFRVKYKSSALGMVWSLLNPLLTMLVYLFVFSTLFKSDVENFPVYLMSGIVLFSYFSEATNLGMASIVGNSSLITKVYMPKLIYPLSKILSSAINLCISFIPLLLVMLITGVTVSKSILLLPLVVMYLVIFSFGVSLLLATMNVFFRDTQFLWGVLLTMLNFLTPIFYPESIIPAQFITLYHMNPLYQIIYFMRTIIISGISPTPVTYLYCTLSTVIPLLLGVWVFRRNQDRFVLYL